MAEVIITTREGKQHRLEIRPGMTLMETIRDGGVDELLALCGGCCSCATCHIHVAPGFADRLPPMSEEENDLLDSSEYRNETSRLSCQIELSDEMDGFAATLAPAD